MVIFKNKNKISTIDRLGKDYKISFKKNLLKKRVLTVRSSEEITEKEMGMFS